MGTTRWGLILSCLALVLLAPRHGDAQQRPSPITVKPQNLRQRIFGVPHSLAVKTTIRIADQYADRYHGAALGNKVVFDFVCRNATTLSIHSVIKLANKMYLGPAREATLATYLCANSRWLTAREAKKTVDQMLLGPQREASLVSFVTENRHRLSSKDLRSLADSLLDPRNLQLVTPR